MTRNWDLIRTLLVAVESLESTSSLVQPHSIPGYDRETVSYHVHLLIQAGLISGRCTGGGTSQLHCTAAMLTWQGHEFLDAVRSDSSWNRIVKAARERGADLSFEVIKAATAGLSKAFFEVVLP